MLSSSYLRLVSAKVWRTTNNVVSGCDSRFRCRCSEGPAFRPAIVDRSTLAGRVPEQRELVTTIRQEVQP
jgi:hypothetical protein